MALSLGAGHGPRQSFTDEVVGQNGPVSTVQGRVWRDGAVVGRDFPLADLDRHLADPHSLVWLDIADPEPAELRALADELGLDELSVESAIAPGERPKATRHRDHAFVTVYATRLVESESPANPLHSRLELARVSVFLVRGGLITVRRGDAFDMDAVVRRWEEDRADLRQGVDFLTWALLDEVIDSHFAAIGRLDDAVEELEDTLFDETVRTREVQQLIYRLRKELVELRRVILPMREVVNATMRHRTSIRMEGVATALDAPLPEMDGYYQDLYDHAMRAAEWTESLRDMVSTLFETNLSLADARLNTVMKKLAGWAAIIAVPTAVTGWFGMNVPYPGYDATFGFWLAVAIIVTATAALYWLFRRQDWI